MRAGKILVVSPKFEDMREKPMEKWPIVRFWALVQPQSIQVQVDRVSTATDLFDTTSLFLITSLPLLFPK
jgi:hypothetical protein